MLRSPDQLVGAPSSAATLRVDLGALVKRQTWQNESSGGKVGLRENGGYVECHLSSARPGTFAADVEDFDCGSRAWQTQALDQCLRNQGNFRTLVDEHARDVPVAVTVSDGNSRNCEQNRLVVIVAAHRR